MTTHFRLGVYAFAMLSFAIPSTALAATLTLVPSVPSVSAGDTVTGTVIVASADQALNAISGTLSFPSDLLEVVSVSKVNSVLSLWVQDPSFSNVNGTVAWGGIVPNPGYQGTGQRVLAIQFRARRAGTANISFTSSAVLANDGNGTNILTAANPARITIVAGARQSATPPVSFSAPDARLQARITSSTHPDQTKWYRSTHAIFDWTNAEGVSAVRLGLDRELDGTPTVLYADPISHKELDLTNGIWYFHVQERGENGWGPISTYKVQIDTENGIIAAAPLFTFFDYIALAALIALLGAIGYINIHYLRHHRRRHIDAKFKAMHAHIHKKFTELSKAIEEEIEKLERVKKKRALTQEEEAIIAEFGEILKKSEEKIEEELESIAK